MTLRGNSRGDGSIIGYPEVNCWGFLSGIVYFFFYYVLGNMESPVTITSHFGHVLIFDVVTC